MKDDDNPGSTGDSNDRTYSKAETATAVQMALALCATCGHTRGDHPEDGPCPVTTTIKTTQEERTIHCSCPEYWPTRDQREDGMRVVAREIGFAGGVGLFLDRRVPTEFWDSLRQGRGLKVVIYCEVAGKSFKPRRDHGVTVGLVESRKLVAEHIDFEATNGD